MSGSAWLVEADPKKLREFQIQYYREQLTLARTIVKEALQDDFVALTIAVFEKIATPTVYLQLFYKKWQKNKDNDTQVKATIQETTPQPPDKWKPTRTKGTIMCSERDVTDEELAKAKANKDGMTWYIPPGDGYRWGLVFKKVKA